MKITTTLAAICAALISTLGLAAELIPYGVAHTYQLCVYSYSSPADLVSTFTWADADIVVSKDGTEANAANAASTNVNDNGLCFDHALTATETQAKNVSVIVQDASGGPLIVAENIEFVTYGHPSSANPTLGPSDVILHGVATGGTTTTLVDTVNLTQAADNWFNNKVIVKFTSGSNAGQVACARTFTASSDTIAFGEVLPNAVASGDHYDLIAAPYCQGVF
jgi:hypothetical protein